MHLNGKGYKATLEGDNRDDATSSDATVRDEYVRKNGDLFREILRMLNAKSEAGKTLMLQIQDEFDNDHDGYGLWEYLKAWASSLTPAEVKVLKKRVEALKFSASETPEKWSYKMQLLLNMWKRIPADKRGGTIADLSDTLLDKVLEVPSCKSYTQYVKAFMDATNGDMTDYQGIVKLLVEQHRQQCAAGGLSGQSGGRGDSDTRRGGSANVAEEEESGEALSTFSGKSGGTNRQGGKSGNGKSNVICGRCGERGHIKKDCPKKCKECGLKSCGGVKGRCMTKGGIPAGLAKIMQPEIKAMIVKRAKEMGAAWAKGQGEAHLFEEQDDDPCFDPSVDMIDEFFDMTMGAEANVCTTEAEEDPSAAAICLALYGDCYVPGGARTMRGPTPTPSTWRR